MLKAKVKKKRLVQLTIIQDNYDEDEDEYEDDEHSETVLNGFETISFDSTGIEIKLDLPDPLNIS